MHGTVCKCKFCGKLYSIGSHEVYQGDPSCCRDCNKEANNLPMQKVPWTKNPYTRGSY